MQPVFQSPRGSLNPGRTALDLVQEPLLYFQRGLAADRRQRARRLLDQVGFDAALMVRKPKALSTGQCQRVAIARALALSPRLLICDEPLSALDLSVQAQILSLLAKLHRRLKFGMLLNFHDIRVVKTISNRIVVMHQGKICETLACGQGGETAAHPYAKALIKAVPQFRSAWQDHSFTSCPREVRDVHQHPAESPIRDRHPKRHPALVRLPGHGGSCPGTDEGDG
jgi:peptide/nickel transport system ATP-binding protein